MRRALFAFALLLAAPAMADDKAKLPPDLQTLPDVPPPPPGTNLDAGPEVEQTVVIRPEGQSVEYRVGGKLFMIKVTPKYGKPYYLVDNKGDGTFARQEGLDSGVRPPQWIIHQF
jgi:hypothetical protein